MRCDVTSWDDQQALVARLDRYGRMDAYFANAGFGAKRGFLEESVEHWKSMIDTNVLGAALSIRASLGHFKDQNSGHLILTSSIAGRRALPGSSTRRRSTRSRRWARRSARSSATPTSR